MNFNKKMSVTMQVAVCVFMFMSSLAAQAQAPATRKAGNPNPELVGMLTKELNITPAQATGGAGAIFGLAKSRLNPADFSQLAAAVPGMNRFLKAAPKTQGESATSSPLGSLGSVAPSGAAGLGGAGGIASLAGSFKSLGLSPAMASKFLPVLQNYVGSRGGPKVAGLLGSVVK